MRARWRRAAAWAAVGLALSVSPAAAETPSGDAGSTVVKKRDGLRFNVPSDWPVEERNGAVGPIPIEEYLAKKFSGLESRLRVLEQQVSALELRLRVTEEEAKRPPKAGGGLRSDEQSSTTGAR